MRAVAVPAAFVVVLVGQPPAHAAHHSKDRPAILFVHGGGWQRETTNSDERAFVRELRQQTGWIVKFAAYTTSEKPRWKVEPHDVLASLRALRARPHVDKSRVYVWGESAGANLAADIAYRHPQLVAGVVSVSGPTDMRTAYQTIPDLVLAYEGETPEQSAAAGHVRYDETSPTVVADMSSPPTFLANSSGDPLVSPSQARELRDRLRGLGVRRRMVIVDGGGWHATLLEPYVERQAVAFLRSVKGSKK